MERSQEKKHFPLQHEKRQKLCLCVSYVSDEWRRRSAAHFTNAYVVIKAIICAQLDILLTSLVRIPMLIHAIRNTGTNTLMCVFWNISCTN